MNISKSFRAPSKSRARVVALRGSTRSGKTYFLSILAVSWLFGGHSKVDGVWSIVRRTLPALRGSVLRDFVEILNTMELLPYVRYNRSELTFTFGPRMVEFFSLDVPEKAGSRKRQYLQINEALELPFSSYQQLAYRTTEQIYLDYNPHDPYSWVKTQIEDKAGTFDCEVFVSTFKGNRHLKPGQIAEIEHLKNTSPAMYEIYARGEWATPDNVVFSNWTAETFDIEETADRLYLGVDFGFSRDPATCILIGARKNKIYMRELVYDWGLTNAKLAERIKATRWAHLKCICDSAEPKSIAELRTLEIRAEKSTKGKDSVKFGIQKMQGYQLIVDQASENLLMEIRNYTWSDKVNGYPQGADHLLDPARYVISKYIARRAGLRSGGSVSNASRIEY